MTMNTIALLIFVIGTANAAINSSNCGKPAIPPKECNTGCTRNDQLMLSEFYRIVGGMVARKGSWPWLIQLKTSGSHYCGGAIVDESTVVTAAHCTENKKPSQYKVHAGSHKKNSKDSTEKIYDVVRIINHPKYSSKTMDNDISIVKIRGRFQYTKQISTVCVAGSEPADGSYVFISGWGSVKGTGNSGVLKQVMMPMMNRAKCNKQHYGEVTGNMICAAWPKGGHDTCQGDSGGPLVQKKGSQWYMYGIVSWGRGCADPIGGVYTNVAKYTSWIRNNS